ncbi:MAG: hypothetical protein LVS60_05120 [Nodosilinea sp. LVE1205-7]|mgnify:CR=1 FL=1|jgi:hypothetical protein
MSTANFWQFFNQEAYPKLARRKATFRYIFEYLDQRNRPVFLIETGCVRRENTWEGEGQSSVLFDRFCRELPGSEAYSVDINPEATNLCKSLVSSALKVHTGDSVRFLKELAVNRPANFQYLDLLYLDSYDVEFNDPHLSALHHMKELMAAANLISAETLVVVDDAPLQGFFVQSAEGLDLIMEPEISGKGKYVADYAKTIGLTPVFTGYQVGWIGF